MTLANLGFVVTFLAGTMLLAAPLQAQSTRSAGSIPSAGIVQKPVTTARASSIAYSSSTESELGGEKKGGVTIILLLAATLGVLLAVASSGNDSPG